MRCFFPVVAALALTSSALAYSETVYVIRHGEKPSDGSNGLNSAGEQRAQCLRTVFGASSGYNIGFIIAEMPESDGKRERPVETVTPLANDLGLTVDIDCSKTDANCVAAAVNKYEGNGPAANSLICWEHTELTDIMAALGVSNPPTYPDASFDIIYTVQNQRVVSTTSENCPGLDN